MQLVVLLETANQGDVAVVKSLLELEDIPFFVENEAFTAIRPLVGNLRLMVPEDRLQNARDAIAHLDV